MMHLESVLKALNLRRTTLLEVKGVPLLRTTAKCWASLQDFQARPDDLLICTYPKAGTTWIQEIVEMIQHRGDPEKCAQAPIYKRIPFIDIFPPKPIPSGIAEADAMPSPRTLKSHLPVQLLPPSFWEQNCKIIYVARNIKDNAVSYFHFHRMNQMLPESGPWDLFLQNFIAGNGPKQDPAREIRKIAQFLGQDLPEPVLNQIVQHTSFENMQANPMVNYSTLPSFILDQTVSPFMRRGIVGDWKEHFTVAQSEEVDDIYAREMKDGSLTLRTQL